VGETPSDYERWRESEAARLIATGRAETDIVRELLILSCHSSLLACQFFEDRLGSEELLGVLLGLAVEDYSGDAQMTASYWVSRFPPGMLAPHGAELGRVAANEWDSVSVHARRALEAVAQQRQAETGDAADGGG
jgi:hypothetical protein